MACQTAALDDAALLVRIRAALWRGYELGFRDTRSLALIANLDIALGEAFERSFVGSELRSSAKNEA